MVPGCQQVGLGNQHPQAVGQSGQGRGQIECRVSLAPGDQSAQVGVTGRILDQADGTVVGVGIGDFDRVTLFKRIL